MKDTGYIPARGSACPWGEVDECTSYGLGVFFVSTPSHGGFFVDAELLEQVPADGREYAAQWSHGWGPQWFEEDEACAYVVATFPDRFPPDHVTIAARTVQRITAREAGA
jgi:hypothetical protein